MVDTCGGAFYARARARGSPNPKASSPDSSTAASVPAVSVHTNPADLPASQDEESLGQASAQPVAFGVDDSAARAQSDAARQEEVPVAKVLGNVLTMGDPTLAHREVRRHCWALPVAFG